MTQTSPQELTEGKNSISPDQGSTLEMNLMESLPRKGSREAKRFKSGGTSDLVGDSARVQRARKKVGQALMATGVPENQLPDMFINKEIARSRNGKAGQIVVHSLSGIHKNAAAQTSRKFEHELTNGKDDIIEKLDAAGNLPQHLERLRDYLVANPRWSFTRAIAEARADLAGAIDAYARGAIALNKLATVRAMYEQMPNLLRDIMRHAIDQEVDCATCFGLGLVKVKADSTKCTLRCPQCKGTGKKLTSSEYKQFAIQKALELARVLPEKQPLVAVQQNNQTVIASNEGLLEKMSRAADEILYNRRDVVDAEEVKVIPPDNTN